MNCKRHDRDLCLECGVYPAAPFRFPCVPGPIQIVDPKGDALKTQIGGGHYKDLAIQPIEYIQANDLGFCEGNIVKYITRWRQKGGLEDIDKVIHYCQLLKQAEERKKR